MVSGARDNRTPSYRGQKIFPLFRLKNLSTVYMRWTRELVVASCLASTGRITWAGETIFSHVNRSDRSPGTRQQNLIAWACEARVFLLYICSQAFPVVHQFVKTLMQLNIPKEERQNFGDWCLLPAFALKSFFTPKSLLQSTETVDFSKTAFYSNYKLLRRNYT